MKKLFFLLIAPFYFFTSTLLLAVELESNSKLDNEIIFISPKTEQKPNSQWQTIDLVGKQKLETPPPETSDFIIVGLVEGEVGYNFIQNQIEDFDDKKGFWTDGKVVFYARGKILGKYLLEISYDSDRENTKIFQDIDPEEYYPVIGDSSIAKKTIRTDKKLYIAIRSDELDLVYGKYKASLNKTRYINFDSDLSGFRVVYQSNGSSKNSDLLEASSSFNLSPSHVEFFQSDSTQTFSEDYLLSTGGYLYYLSKKNIRPNTLNIYIEIRNTKAGSLLSRYVLKKEDYAADYANGRITLKLPIPSLLYNRHQYNTLDDFSNSVYLWATYESYEKNTTKSAFTGGRVQLALNDDTQVGGTYLEKVVNGKKSKMTGFDLQIKTDETNIYAEHAKSNFSNKINLSSDGGLSYVESSLNPDNKEKSAFYVKAKGTYLEGKLDLDLLAASESFGFTAFNGNEVKSAGKLIADGHISYKEGGWLSGYRLKTQRAPEGATKSVLDQINGYAKRTHRFYGHGQIQDDFQVNLVYDVEQVAASSNYEHKDATKTLSGSAKFSLDDYTKVSLGLKKVTPNSQNEKATETFLTTGRLEALLTENLAADAAVEYDQHKRTATYSAGLTYFNEGVGVRFSSQKSSNSDSTQSVGLQYQVNPHFKVSATKSLGLNNGYSSGISYRPNKRFEVGVGIDQSQKSAKNSVAFNTSYTADDLTLKGRVSSGSKTIVTGGDIIYKVDDLVIIKGGVVTDNQLDTQRYLGVDFKDRDLSISGQTKFSEKDGSSKSQISANYQKDQNQSYRVSYRREDGDKNKKTDGVVFTNRYDLGRGVSVESDLSHTDYGDDRTRKSQAYRLLQNMPSGTSYGITIGSYQEFAKQKNGEGWSAKLAGNRYNGESFSANVESGDVLNLENKIVNRFLIKFDYAYVSKKNLPKEFSRFSRYIKWNYRTDETDDLKVTQKAFKAGFSEYIDADWSFHLGADYSQSNDAKSQIENYAKYTVGVAYRPVENDQLNLVGMFRFIEQDKPKESGDVKTFDTYYQGYILALEGVWQVNETTQLSEKVAYRYHKEKARADDLVSAESSYLLWGNRLKFRVEDDLDLSLEYALRHQLKNKESDHSLGVYADKRFENQIVLSGGYKFNYFDTNLTNLSQKTNGPYFRISGLLSEMGFE